MCCTKLNHANICTSGLKQYYAGIGIFLIFLILKRPIMRECEESKSHLNDAGSLQGSADHSRFQFTDVHLICDS